MLALNDGREEMKKQLLARGARIGFPEALLLGDDKLVQEIEGQKVSFHGWATPGDSLSSAALDVARTTCRRAERRICALQETNQLQNPEIIIYLNRLSDALWLLARWVETELTKSPDVSRT